MTRKLLDIVVWEIRHWYYVLIRRPLLVRKLERLNRELEERDE